MDGFLANHLNLLNKFSLQESVDHVRHKPAIIIGSAVSIATKRLVIEKFTRGVYTSVLSCHVISFVVIVKQLTISLSFREASRGSSGVKFKWISHKRNMKNHLNSNHSITRPLGLFKVSEGNKVLSGWNEVISGFGMYGLQLHIFTCK